MDLQFRRGKFSFHRLPKTEMERESLDMSRRRVVRPDPMDDFKGFRWIECTVDVAVNPVTKNQVTLTPPVRIGSYEDFARFNDQWEDFCTNSLTGDPSEVCFTLE